MSNRAYFIERWDAEGPGTLRVLGAVPEERSDYRPDPKGRSAKELAATLVGEATSMAELLDTGRSNMVPGAIPSIETLVSTFARIHAGVAERARKLDDAAWEKRVVFTFMGHPVFDMSLGRTLWAFLFDGIHHRGQLSTYLRPMGSKVPSIYGPSADSEGSHDML
jgi:uncharacterized damage-inducible protein DinB